MPFGPQADQAISASSVSLRGTGSWADRKLSGPFSWMRVRPLARTSGSPLSIAYPSPTRRLRKVASNWGSDRVCSKNIFSWRRSASVSVRVPTAMSPTSSHHRPSDRRPGGAGPFHRWGARYRPPEGTALAAIDKSFDPGCRAATTAPACQPGSGGAPWAHGGPLRVPWLHAPVRRGLPLGAGGGDAGRGPAAGQRGRPAPARDELQLPGRPGGGGAPPRRPFRLPQPRDGAPVAPPGGPGDRGAGGGTGRDPGRPRLPPRSPTRALLQVPDRRRGAALLDRRPHPLGRRGGGRALRGRAPAPALLGRRGRAAHPLRPLRQRRADRRRGPAGPAPAVDGVRGGRAPAGGAAAAGDRGGSPPGPGERPGGGAGRGRRPAGGDDLRPRPCRPDHRPGGGVGGGGDPVPAGRRRTSAPDEDERACLERVAHLVTVWLLRSQDLLHGEQGPGSRFLDDLLHGRLGDEDAVVRQAAMLGIDLGVARAVLRVGLCPTGRTRSEPPFVTREAAEVLRQVADRRGLEPVVDLRGRDAVLLIRAEGADTAGLRALTSGVLRDAGARLGGARLAAGLGRICRRLGDYAESHREAALALDVARASPEGGVRTHEELGFYGLVARAVDPGMLDALAERTLRPLLQADVRHHTRYVPTLAAYLRANRRLKPAAAALHVHVNTLRYRLARIERLLGTDLEDVDGRFLLELAVRLLEARGGAIGPPADPSPLPRREAGSPGAGGGAPVQVASSS